MPSPFHGSKTTMYQLAFASTYSTIGPSLSAIMLYIRFMHVCTVLNSRVHVGRFAKHAMDLFEGLVYMHVAITLE